MEKLLYIVPHLSTGGLPQYTLKMIQEFIKEFDVYCIEYSDHSGGQYVVQRNQVVDLLGNNFYSLPENKIEMVDIIDNISPDIIHFQEIPDSFVDVDILEKVYKEDRPYNIVVTTHGSLTEPSNIIFGADKYILVSDWSKDRFTEVFDESICDIWEYPITNIEYDKDLAKKELGFDPEYKHVLNVGLFTPGKNQKELIELAKEFKNNKVIFHFVGNQAINFKNYWEPIMKDLPDNCIWHGERSDADKFYKAADVFYFTSNFELNPLVVKEALSYGLPTFIKKLDTYKNCYDGLVTYILNDKQANINRLKESLFAENKKDEILIVLAHPNTHHRKQLLKECLSNTNKEILLSTNYVVDESIQKMCDHVLYTKNNPILYKDDFSKYNVTYRHWWIGEDGIRHEKIFDYEHGYAVYTLIQNALRYAKNLGKNKIHILNYDYLISDTLLNKHLEVLQENDLILYQHGTTNYGETSYSSGIMSGNIESFFDFFERYNDISEYYLDGNENGFGILEAKLYRHYANNKKIKIHTEIYESLKTEYKLDREGTGIFSNKNEYEDSDFATIAKAFNCDKSIAHRYEYPYDKFLNKFRDKECTIFEIGIEAGKSVKVWENFLPKSKIYGMDIDIEMELSRGKVFKGDQSKIGDLVTITEIIKKSDIIIDDGSHIADHQLKTFYYLFENLLDWGGVYVIEDIECSYWRANVSCYGYESGYTNIIDYFLNINHSVNANYSNHTNNLNIKSVSYYPNCIVIEKLNKDEIRTEEYRFKHLL